MRSGGATGGEDSYGESFTYLDPKRAKEFAETGLIFTQYWLYVSASYPWVIFWLYKEIEEELTHIMCEGMNV